MDLNYSAQEEAFRQRVRDFLKASLPQGWGSPGYIASKGDAYVDFLRGWQRRLYDHGLLGLEWPREFGGQDASLVQSAIFGEEQARAHAPHPLNVVGLFLTGPTILAHGTEEQKRRHLRKILSCEEIWCQGFSEPGSGSDLASLRTRAELDGDHFVVNGQKVWTSLAHIADWCMLLVRTDPAAPKHRGVSYLLVDMKTPGIRVKPLRQMTGDAEFNEVFFEDVRVPRANLLGGLNNGWQVAMTTLMNERGAPVISVGTQYYVLFTEIVDLCRRSRLRGAPALGDPLLRQQIAQLYLELQGMRLTSYRAFSTILKGDAPGPEGSILKLMWSETNQRMQDLVMAVQGPASQLMEGSAHTIDHGRWQFEFLYSRANTIQGGTSEIQRNTLAERVLGLPRSR
ncbi:MAG TPA: acyl-CoA dehydrogenase [Candidatus Binataceae bacterium]|nr:acyl-CoA dehydrogenase [Candidatus Binataceae bacterium]